jgi:hypothetical protein
MQRALDRGPGDVVSRMMQRGSGAGYFDLLAGGPPGPESTQQADARATLLGVMEQQRGGGGSPAEQLALQTMLRKARDAYGASQAHGALEQELVRNQRARPTGSEQLAGFEHAGLRPQEAATTTQAMVMAGNRSQAPTMAPRGYTDPRPTDPRLEQQHRNAMQRTSANPIDAMRRRLR